MAFNFKHNFVIASIIGAALVGSIHPYLRVWGFMLCVIGNIYWIWYHKNDTGDKEMLYIFIAYLIINTLAIINNIYAGTFVW
jgi:hypothetical protein